MKRYTPTRKYKDSVLRMLFGSKQELLGLYNALTGTDYSDPEQLTVTALKNATFRQDTVGQGNTYQGILCKQ